MPRGAPERRAIPGTRRAMRADVRPQPIAQKRRIHLLASSTRRVRAPERKPRSRTRELEKRPKYRWARLVFGGTASGRPLDRIAASPLSPAPRSSCSSTVLRLIIACERGRPTQSCSCRTHDNARCALRSRGCRPARPRPSLHRLGSPARGRSHGKSRPGGGMRVS